MSLIATFLLHQLQAWEMEVATAMDGQETLSMLRGAVQAARPYRLALFDVQMPVMDGWMLARSIKTDQSISGRRLIILTSVEQVVGPAELQTEGIEAYGPTPLRVRLFWQAVRSTLADYAWSNARYTQQLSRTICPQNR